MFTPPKDVKNDPRPLLVIADSRGRMRCWDNIRKWPYMRDVLALCSSTTPQEYLGYLKDRRIGKIVAGNDHIDMRAALEALNREYGVKVLRVDSGGTLNSVLLHAGLVSEVSVLIYPFIAGGKSDPSLSDPLKAGIAELQVSLKLQCTEVVGNGIVWARYLVQERSET
jgi:2,5-diamino-6-(ribosylamino)-4(3H)-pyrimidinone 5'-phosphate reductase